VRSKVSSSPTFGAGTVAAVRDEAACYLVQGANFREFLYGVVRGPAWWSDPRTVTVTEGYA
jgi:hypothetical protein